MIKSFIEAINKGAIPNIENTWSSMCKVESMKAFESAESAYEIYLRENLGDTLSQGGSINSSEFIHGVHKVAKENAIAIFKNKALGESSEEFLLKLKETGLNPKQRMIVLHYDILTEGIDTVFTGVLPFKGLGKLKFIQTYGRVARLDPEDRKKIRVGEISSNDLELMYKPYGWVIIPALLFEDIDDNQRIKNLVQELRDYGFNPVDDMVVSNIGGGGIGVVDGLEALNEVKKVEPKVGVLIETLQSTMEDERIASLSSEELVTEFL
jgi:hypothetical protein